MDFLNVAAASSSDSNTKVLMLDGNTVKSRTVSGLSLGSIPDGDKGDITTSASGATWTIDNTAVTYAKIQNVSATSRILGRKTANAGSTEECTLSEVLDFVGSAAQGDILYRGASSWTRLGAGTSGQYLKTQGAGANPVWDTVSGSSSKTFQATLIASSISNEYNPGGVYIWNTVNGWGWPTDVGNGWTDEVSWAQCTKFLVPFNPTNYRFTVQVQSDPNYNGGDPDGGDFGVKFQYATSNTLNNGWQDIATVGFRGKVRGDLVDVSGSLSISGSPTAVYIRTLCVYTLTDGGTPTTQSAQITLRNFIANFWN